MIQCPVCQVSNEENSQFCRECGNRIERRTEPRPKLKSPLLSGYEEPETYDDEPNVSKLRGVKPSKPKAPGDKPKLRSPLLRDTEDDDDDNWENNNNPQEERRLPGGKNKLRSPLLGEGDDDDDFDSPPSGGGMPRVRRKPPSNTNPSISNADQNQTGGQSTGNQSKGGKPKLRSRLLDTSDYEEVDDDWDEDEPHEDANALRSPLLRARKHQDDKPDRSQSQSHAPGMTPQMAHQPAPQPAPATPPPQPAPMAPPPQPQPLSVQNQAPPGPAPTRPTQSGIFEQQPTFQPPNLPAPTPEIPNQKPLQMPGQPDENYLPPPTPQRDTKPSPSSSSSPPKTPPMPHPLAAATGPDDRRSTSRRQSTTDRRSRSGLLGAGAPDDDDDDDYANSNSSRGRSGVAQLGAEQLKMVFMAAVSACIFKVVYLGWIIMQFGIAGTAIWMILDQLAFIFVCVGLIMYSSQSMSSR